MRLFLIFCVAASSATTAWAAEKPVSLGTFQDWSAYTAGSGNDKTCYALSQPVSSLPKGVNRDPIYFLISDFPGRNTKGEPEIVPGYSYKDGSTVKVTVGSDHWTFFSKNENGTGAAWLKSHDDEVKLVSAMKKGARAVVTGVSSRGTTTTDTYSLSGVTAALQKADAECKM